MPQPKPLASDRLAQLATGIAAAHAACVNGLRHAITAGQLLIEAKGLVAHGQWLPWLMDHCRVTERTAQKYMQVARDYPKLSPANAARVADMALRDALRSISQATRLLARDKPDHQPIILDAAESPGVSGNARQCITKGRVRVQFRGQVPALPGPQPKPPKPPDLPRMFDRLDGLVRQFFRECPDDLREECARRFPQAVDECAVNMGWRPRTVKSHGTAA